MRTRMMILIGALLVASAGYAQAQDTKPTPAQTPSAAPSPTFTPTFGTIDFGYRGSSFDGDVARYNRYRDLRDGVDVTRFRFNRENETLAFRAQADNVGYRDQRYLVDFQSIGKLKAVFEFNSNPLYQAQATGLFSGSGSNLGVNDDVQKGIQAGTLTPAQAFSSFTQPFDIKSRRDFANFNLTYTATRDIDLKVTARSTSRNGSNLQSYDFGNSPGNLVVLDMGVPVDDRTTDLKTKLEWANTKGLLSVGYDGSWYNQNVPTFTWDNPLRFTDSATAGPAFGRTALWPTNSVNTFNANGSYKMAGHSRASAAISYGTMSQNEALLPNTTNTALVAPPVERGSAEAKIDVTSMLLGFNSRPTEALWLNARFRYYDYSNNTPEFTNQVVTGDYSVGAIEITEPETFSRKTFDLDASYSPIQYLSFNGGYSRENYDNKIKPLNVQGRIYGSTAEDIFRVSVDSTGNQYVTARLKYEHSNRTGKNFDEEMLVDIGEQTGMRHYDIAPRDRDRVTGVFTVTPVPYLDFNASVSTGRDKYPDSQFGLQDNKNNGYTVGFDIVPSAVVDFGVNYGFEKYETFQYSRTANPPANDNSVPKQFDDPRRDWSNNINDKVKTWSANLNLVKAVKRTDIRLGYDLSDGNTNYAYGLAPVTTLAAPVQYTIQPKNRIEVAKVDAQYFVRENIALGVGYWYEHYKVQDFALDPALMDQGYLAGPPSSSAPNGAPVGFFSGYAYEPYTAHTVYVRMRYLW